jgi:hypothetical protein
MATRAQTTSTVSSTLTYTFKFVGDAWTSSSSCSVACVLISKVLLCWQRLSARSARTRHGTHIRMVHRAFGELDVNGLLLRHLSSLDARKRDRAARTRRETRPPAPGLLHPWSLWLGRVRELSVDRSEFVYSFASGMLNARWMPDV